jgi:hypothetical protein
LDGQQRGKALGEAALEALVRVHRQHPARSRGAGFLDQAAAPGGLVPEAGRAVPVIPGDPAIHRPAQVLDQPGHQMRVPAVGEHGDDARAADQPRPARGQVAFDHRVARIAPAA